MIDFIWLYQMFPLQVLVWSNLYPNFNVRYLARWNPTNIVTHQSTQLLFFLSLIFSSSFIFNLCVYVSVCVSQGFALSSRLDYSGVILVQ